MSGYKEDFALETIQFYKSVVARLRGLKLSQNVPDIAHLQVIPHATYSPWDSDQAFQTAYQKIKSHTLVDIYRCYELWSLAQRLQEVPGLILEIGVWRGGSGALLALAAPERRKLLVDSFVGVIKAGSKDTIYKGGEHSDTSAELVQALLNDCAALHCTVITGNFPEGVDPNLRQEPIALCHIDVDTYDSARDCFFAVWPNLSVGGAVVFDDYGFWGCEGVTRLGNELKQQFGPTQAVFSHNLNGHAVLTKIR